MASGADIMAVIEASGGVERISKGLIDFTRRFKLLDSQIMELIELHPNKWVAMPEGDDLVFADSPDALLANLRECGKLANTAAIRFLDPNPRILIV